MNDIRIEPRTLSIGDILDESVETAWSRLLLFIGAVLFLEGPPVLLVNALLGFTLHIVRTKPDLLPVCLVSASLQILFVAFSFMCSRAFIIAAVSAAIRGRKLSFSETVEALLGRKGSLLAHAFVSVMGLSFISAVLVVCCRLIADLPAGKEMGVILAAALALTAVSVLSVRLSLSLPLLFLEAGKGFPGSIRKSWTLTGGSFWKTATLWLLANGSLLAAVFISLQSFSYIFSIIAALFILPFVAFIETYLALDLKIRKDAYDIWLVIEQQEASPGGSRMSEQSAGQEG
jgi:hypothetical protein